MWVHSHKNTYEVWEYRIANHTMLELHHNSEEYLKKALPPSCVPFGKGPWEAALMMDDGITVSWVEVPDTCTTLEERQAWCIAMLRTL